MVICLYYLQLVKKAQEDTDNAKIMQELKTYSGVLPCPKCGSPSRRSGKRKYKGG